MVKRQKIRAYNSRQFGVVDETLSNAVGRTIQRVQSGFVHGAAGYIMDLYNPLTHRSLLAGVLDSPVNESYVIDAANYPYRVLMSAVTVAKKLGNADFSEYLMAEVRSTGMKLGIPTFPSNT